MNAEGETFFDLAEIGRRVEKADAQNAGQFALLSDRQKASTVAAQLRLLAYDFEKVMTPAAVLSALLAAYLEYGTERLPAKVLAAHLRSVVERLECPPH